MAGAIGSGGVPGGEKLAGLVGDGLKELGGKHHHKHNKVGGVGETSPPPPAHGAGAGPAATTTATQALGELGGG